MPRNSNHVPVFSRAQQAPTAGIAQQSLIPMESRTTSGSRPESPLGALPSVVYECGLDLTTKTMSPNAFELIGIRSEDVTGKRALWQDRILLEDRTRLLSKLNSLKRSEVASETHRLINDRGLSVWVAHSFRKIRRNDNETDILGCFVPLSTADCVSALDADVINQFVHRIGNHFQLINLFIDSLKRHGSNPDEIEALQQTVDRAVLFTRAFSQYSQCPLLNSVVMLGDILGSLIQSTMPFLKDRNIAISSAWHRSVDTATVLADPTSLEYAFGSVLQNAFDATKDGGRLVIDGTVEARESIGSVVRVSIVDAGAGMDRSELAKAVTPFSTSKRDHDGLGLSSALRIIELHGGVMNIKSKPGCGTEVEIVLPIDPGEASNGEYQR